MAYGASGKGSPAKGSWGDRYLIETPRTQKHVSCGMCSNYCMEDKSCNITAIYPPIDGYDYWKKCEQFDLAIEFDNEDNRKKVKDVKGCRYLVNKEKIEQELINKEWDKVATIWRNMYILSLEKRLHLFPYFEECELIMQNDANVRVDKHEQMDNILAIILMLCEKTKIDIKKIFSFTNNYDSIISRILMEECIVPDEIHREITDSGNEIILMTFSLANFFVNAKSKSIPYDKIFLWRIDNNYILEVFISHFSCEENEPEIRRWRYFKPNYGFNLYGDKDSLIARHFEKIFKNESWMVKEDRD